MGDKFWIEHADLYSNEGFEINEMGTHPHLVRAFNKYNPGNKILDYGCGDGSLINKFSENEIEVSLFDTSEAMLDLARSKLNKYKPTVYKNAIAIPKNYFDCVFLSMVLICVDTEEEIEFIINRIKDVKKKKGLVLVANPHPCFRDEPFSSYYTEFTLGTNFNYFNNGQKHEIYLRDKSIHFYDFNWTLSYTLNTFLKKGLELVEILELKDNKTNSFYNEDFSPSIIYVFK